MNGFGINCRVVAEGNEPFEPDYWGDTVFIVPNPYKVKELTEDGQLPRVKPAYRGNDLGEAFIRHVQKFFADHAMDEHFQKLHQTLDQRNARFEAPQQQAAEAPQQQAAEAPQQQAAGE